MTENIAHDVTHALSNVVEQGTGRAVQTLDRPVAGKTGTKDRTNDDGSSDVVSAWFVAYTRQISTAVMYVAGNDGNGDLDTYARPGDSTFFGGTYPALTWADYMETATEGQAVKQFPEPAYVNKEEVPLPEPTIQETQQQPTEQPSTTSPARTRLLSRPPLGSSPSGRGGRTRRRRRAAATKAASYPVGGGPPAPAKLPPAAAVEQQPDCRDRGPSHQHFAVED